MKNTILFSLNICKIGHCNRKAHCYSCYAVKKSKMEQFRRRRVQTLENTCLLQCSFSKVPVLFLEIFLMECDQNTHKKYPECMINQFGAVWESTILSPGLGCSKTALFFMKNCSSRLYMML